MAPSANILGNEVASKNLPINIVILFQEWASDPITHHMKPYSYEGIKVSDYVTIFENLGGHP